MHNHHHLRQQGREIIFTVVITAHQQNIPGPSRNGAIIHLRLIVAAADRADELLYRLIDIIFKVNKTIHEDATNHQEQQQENIQQDTRPVWTLTNFPGGKQNSMCIRKVPYTWSGG